MAGSASDGERRLPLWLALADFGAPLDDLDVRKEDLTTKDIVAQFGLPPNRIDILTGVSGLDFESAWPKRAGATLEGVRVPVLSRDDKACAFGAFRRA